MKNRAIILFLILLTLQTPFPAHGGTDDSDLQVITIKGSDMLGCATETITEDTKNASRFEGMVTAGGSLMVFSIPWENGATQVDPNVILSASSTNSIRLVDAVRPPGLWQSGRLFYCYFDPTSSETYTFYHTGSSTYIGNPKVAGASSFLFVFSQVVGGLDTVYSMISNSLYYTNSGGVLFLPVATPWTTAGTYALSATIWQSRLFVVSQSSSSSFNRLYYSSTTDLVDFTVGPTAGGIIDVPNTMDIYKIFATSYGLVLVTYDGAFLLSGSSLASSWRLDRIHSWISGSKLRACQSGDNIFVRLKNGMFLLNGLKLEKISDNYKDDNENSSVGRTMAIWQERFIVLPPNIYDLQTKSWGTVQFSIISSVSSNGEFIASELTSGGMAIRDTPIPQFDPFKGIEYSTMTYLYRSAWLSLDGNPSNIKEIKRIEIDAFFNNKESMEIVINDGANTITKQFQGELNIASSYLYTYERKRTKTYIFNAPTKNPFRRMQFTIAFKRPSDADYRPSGNPHVKEMRIYYRNLGNNKGAKLR